MPKAGSLKQIESVGDPMSFECSEVLVTEVLVKLMGPRLARDRKVMHLSIGRLLKTGWKPRYNSEEVARLAVRALLREEREHPG